MDYQEIQKKLDEIKKALADLHQNQNKITNAKFENLTLQLSEYEDLMDPEMDEAEMFYVEGQLDELALRLGIYKP